MQVQLTSGLEGLNFDLNLHLCPYFVCVSSEGSGKTVHLHKLISVFAAQTSTELDQWLHCSLSRKYSSQTSKFQYSS